MNARTFNIVVLILGATILVGLFGVIFLAADNIEIPGVLENIAVAALAGMTGLLARSPGAEEPQQVRVVNAPLAVTEDEPGAHARETRQMHSRRVDPGDEPDLERRG